MIYFWGHKGNDLKRCLSNFYPCEFVSQDGIKFNCSEQYFMYQKALLFNDLEIAKEILKVSEPKKIKTLGRKVRNFNGAIWDKHKYEIMKEACFLKFSQNEGLKKYLKSTKGNELVEASPFDRIWGIGFNEFEASKNKKLWGENLLGKILMEVREMI